MDVQGNSLNLPVYICYTLFIEIVSIIEMVTMSDSPFSQRNSVDLFEIITILGDRAVNSTWVGHGLECFGDGAEELYSFTDNDLAISGKDILRLTSQIYQTIDGDLKAYENNSPSHWIFIRAWDGTGFYFETNDPSVKELYKTRFDFYENVEAEYQPHPPYVNFFLNFILRKKIAP